MTSENFASYALASDGSVRHWLACGARTAPLQYLETIIAPDGSPWGDGGRWAITNAPDSLDLKQRVYQSLPPTTWTPGKQVYHNETTAQGEWQYRRAEEDAVIDFSLFNFNPTYMQAWVFTGLEVAQPVTLQADLITIGPAHVWLNGERVFTFADRFGYVEALYIPVTLNLNAGMNDLYVHGEMIGWREARLALGLRLHNPPNVGVRVPIGDTDPLKWHAAEDGLSNLVIKQFAFPTLPGKIALHQSADEPFAFTMAITMPLPDLLYQPLDTLNIPTDQTLYLLAPGDSANFMVSDGLLATMSGLPGENHLKVTLKPADGTPIAIMRSIWASDQPFSDTPYGDYDSRKREALEHVARMPFDVLGTMCAVETSKSEFIDSDAVALACHFMENRNDCADFYAVSLMALMFKFGDSPALRPPERERIEAAFRGFKFWIDEPGIDAMCYFTENHQILFHVTQYLAGQVWREGTFTNSGFTGVQQHEIARPRIESWIVRRLQGSFSEWDSNAYMALDAFALLVLVEYGDDDDLRAIATDLLHKIFFLIACQSFKGAHGSTHGRCYVSGLKSSRFENTSGLQRIAWGMGIFNGETRATGMLALSKNYRVPDVIQQIGADQPEILNTFGRASAEYRPEYDLKTGEWDARTITRRTPDYMLSACMDHRPGAVGIQEHLWQAAFSPEAVVFTNYPGNSQEHGNARPNFWAGSARLPRVAMFDRIVMCLYDLQPGVGLGFSHAYFPTAHFDEYAIDGQWAFARYGDGYLALWSDGDLTLTETGQHAGQELRSANDGQVWMCHVGNADRDVSYVNFRKNVLRTHPTYQDEGGGLLQFQLSPDDALTFTWRDGVRVNEHLQTWENLPHYGNIYTNTAMDADTMKITHNGQSITLDLRRGTPIPP